ncbi:MAG: HEAT repeat domain-containing protein [Planctomycetota bacterium]|nr:HEAT repeat domain-containing protein [Planctomycetota bacterium]
MLNRPALTAFALLASLLGAPVGATDVAPGPYDRQVAEHLHKLAADASPVRARAAEALGFLRVYAAEPALLARLEDPAVEVRRQATMALAWCGSRLAVPPLLQKLDDADWLVCQAAHVSLTNLTGMEFPFDANASAPRRTAQARAWRAWWAAVPADRPPQEVLDLLGRAGPVGGYSVTASTTYRGPPDVLVDGQIGSEYWQTKDVDPPQWCTVDLGRPIDVKQVTVHQYGPGYCLTEYELAISLDDRTYETVRKEKGKTPPTLTIEFVARKARYVRITSFGSENPHYPTTFFEVEINGSGLGRSDAKQLQVWRQERGVRALGALGGHGSTPAILEVLGDRPPSAPLVRPLVRAAIRALGRLRQEAGFQYLVTLLDNPMWARCAADALGDFGDRRAVPQLLAAYLRYAKLLDGKDPPDVPADDKMGFPSEDRMLETPYWIAYALCRLPLDAPADLQELRELAPLVMANLPGDNDTFMLYQPEVGHLLTRHLLERSGLRQEACEQAFQRLGQPRRVPPPGDNRPWSIFPPARVATWLPAVCTESADLPRLAALLSYQDGWVRMNAAKALTFLGDRRAIAPLAHTLANAKAEVEFGYSGVFKNEEYTDPAPRWRESLLRALGILGAHDHTGLLVGILNDQGSVLEVRRAAADALADLGNPAAIAALQEATVRHDFFSIRHVAHDALRARGIRVETGAGARGGEGTPGRPDSGYRSTLSQLPHGSAGASPAPALGASGTSSGSPGLGELEAIVFIKGDNDVPNTPQTVEQADRWRQTYVVTDEGPTYRPGDNLYVLRPPRPDGAVTPLTRFTEGYVADPEVSWEGTEVVFCHRGKDNPWWQIYTIGVDGTALTQLTEGPYHSICPVWLPDGRIAFASSRVGIRDEYHGYACTALCVMDRDGRNLRPIATNIGRDNEPAVLPDGRLVFSRLEVFYSRNKTELTLHAVHPDGTKDVVLYGPERRAFWRQLEHGTPDPADVQEAPLTHRVLRMTQPQSLSDGRNIIVSTQGGLTRIEPRRDTETLLCPDLKDYAYTTPFPLPDGRVLCSVTYKTPDRKQVDLGIYVFDPATGRRELVYNDPATADYEARPIRARVRPPVQMVEEPGRGYSGRFFCSTVFATQERDVPVRGRLVRLIEGVPQVGRHSTQTNPPEPVWKNHGGTLARVLGMAPLTADGSFYLEVPADRLLHLQVLDSDRRVVGNQLTWIYTRPGEVKSCVGCHEHPHTTVPSHQPWAAHHPPLDFLPRGDEFAYRAKAWFKGSLPGEIEERTRTVRAVNLLGR